MTASHPTPTRRPAGRAGRRLAALVVASAAVLAALPATSPPAAAAPPGGGGSAVPAPREGTWPLAPRPPVVEAFRPPESAWGEGHRGVDLAGRPGQPVRAALGGTVSFAAVLAGRGVLVVDHGATRTTYEPVAALVPVGTVVAAGEVVGRLEVAGSHCLPAACLHWGWRRGREYLDPLTLVGGGPVRLLPLAGLAGRAGAGSPSGAAVGMGHRPVGLGRLQGLAGWDPWSASSPVTGPVRWP